MSRPTVFTSDDIPLLNAYRFHRYRAVGNAYPRKAGPNGAIAALAAARRDVANGKSRWPASSRPFPAVSWQALDTTPAPFKRRERLGFVADPSAAGLRFVGRADEFGLRSIKGRGWYTDSHQEETVFGVVFQLAGRNGASRFVAGYQASHDDHGAMVDLGTIFEEARSGNAWNVDPKDHGEAQEAARFADATAETAAEEARDYDLAWQAGTQWAEAKEEVASARRDIRDSLATRRAIRADMARVGIPATSREWARACGMVRDRVSSALERIAALRERMGKLSAGDHEGRIFYPDSRLKGAFNDGAGETVL